MKLRSWHSLILLLASVPVRAAADGVNGNWISPGGAIITVYPCGDHVVCAKLIRTIHPAGKDDKNPDENLKSRPLCGLQIGKEFVLTDPSHAKDGKIYDPDSGKTYSATMAATDSELKLHGYVGISLFGRTEVWKRTDQAVAACAA